MNPLIIVELILKIVLTAMEGQPPEVRARLWEIYLKDLEWWRKALKIDKMDASNVDIPKVNP